MARVAWWFAVLIVGMVAGSSLRTAVAGDDALDRVAGLLMLAVGLGALAGLLGWV